MITIISGTNRPESNTYKLAKYYQKRLTDKHIATDILPLSELPPNFLETDMFGKRSDAFRPIQERISSTEKFIFILPEYNGSFPGVAKAFVDACQFPDSFFNKKAALVGISSGKYGNIRGIEHFSGVCSYIRLHVLPLRIHIPYILSEFDDDQQLFKPDTLKFTEEQIEAFIQF